jgi:hypothetical protein
VTVLVKRCPTCCRNRSPESFQIRDEDEDGNVTATVPLCHSCRETLWDDPDSADEGA